MTLKFDGWAHKTIGHLFYTTSSFVYHFNSISVFKLELQSGNTQFGSKLAIYCPMWPQNLMDDLRKTIGTSPMLLQALCLISKPSVNSNLNHSPETQFKSKSAILSCVTLKFDRWPWKTIGNLFSMLLQALCIISKPLENSNWSYGLETPNLGQNRQFI